MQNTRWVAAAPFRAHLNHISSSTGVPWPVLALHADLPLGLVHHLLDVRPGRQVQRIAPELAAQVYAIDPKAVLALRTRLAPARASRQTLRRLLHRGWTVSALALRLHLSTAQVDAIATGFQAHVPALLELEISALLALADPTPASRARLPRAA